MVTDGPNWYNHWNKQHETRKESETWAHFPQRVIMIWCYWKVERLYNKEYGEISRGDLYRKTLEHLALKRSLKTAGTVPWGG